MVAAISAYLEWGQPFYISPMLTSMECQLFTDASDVGFGCYFQDHWCQGKFPETFQDWLMSINWRELYGITMALAIWGDHFRGKRILLHCDNTPVLQIIMVHDGAGPLINLVWHVEQL